MPSTTPLMGLPYPNGTDAPCDFDEQWCAFTDAIDGVFDTFIAGAARTFPAVPAALMQLTVPTTVENDNPVPFDTVHLDTAAMTDLDADPYSIFIRRFGRYTCAAGISVPSAAAIGDDIFNLRIRTLLPSTVSTQRVTDLNTTLPVWDNTHTEVFTLLEGDVVQLEFFQASGGPRLVERAWLAVYWHADQELP